MKSRERPDSNMLGQYLEKKRQDAGMSLRRLELASGVPFTTIRRLLYGEVENPTPEHLQSIAKALKLDESEVFGLIGVTPPQGLPGVAPYLRAKFKLKGDALSEATREIQKIIDKYDGIPPDK
jgi:transcriptional regulator with XRE-family HTH domain